MFDIRSVAVFCGAQPGNAPEYLEAAKTLGSGLAERGMRLVYGGGRIGLMGAVADGTLSAGGSVTGVIPEFLTRWEVAHEGVMDLTVTDTMHTRKRMMFDIADAFVIMPGGLGTLDETFEIVTWRQLKLHDKPILFCDIHGWAQPLAALVESVVSRGFAQPAVKNLFEVCDGVAATLKRLETLRAPVEAKENAVTG